MSLRTRLVLVVFVLLAAGLIASNIASATALRSYLLGQVDERLDTAAALSGRFVLDDRRPPPTNTDAPPPGVRTPNGVAEIQAALIGSQGELLRTFQGPFSATSEAFDHLPSSQVDRALAGETVRFDMS